MSEQFKAAFTRALGVGALSAASTALASVATDASTKSLLVASGTAFLAPFIARWGGEGYYDTRRADRGDVLAGDVKAKPDVATPGKRAA